jgi:hypothetical protein
MNVLFRSPVTAAVLTAVAIVAGVLAWACGHKSATQVAAVSPGFGPNDPAEQSASAWGAVAVVFGAVTFFAWPLAVIAWVYQLRWWIHR